MVHSRVRTGLRRHANLADRFLRQVATLLHNIPVQCAQEELAIFQPPGGQTCEGLSTYCKVSDFLTEVTEQPTLELS